MSQRLKSRSRSIFNLHRVKSGRVLKPGPQPPPYVKTSGFLFARQAAFAGFIYSLDVCPTLEMSTDECWHTALSALNRLMIDFDEVLLHQPAPKAFRKVMNHGEDAAKEAPLNVYAFLYLHKNAGCGGQVLTDQILLHAHRILCGQGTGEDYDGTGKYRSVTLVPAIAGELLGDSYGDSKVTAKHHQIPGLMTEWINEYNGAVENCKDPVTTGLVLRVKFLKIYPFMKGNGRMADLMFCFFVISYFPLMITGGKRERLWEKVRGLFSSKVLMKPEMRYKGVMNWTMH